MANTVLDNGTRAQYTSAASQTNFSYPFKIFGAQDLKVYSTPAGQQPNPVTDIQVLNTDYTVTGVGNPGGGDVVFVVPRGAGDIITIERDIAVDRLFDYSVGGDFTGDSINQQLDKLTMLVQQNEGINENRQLTYQVTDELTTGDVTLPQLATDHFWKKSAGGAIVSVECTDEPGCTTLRSELLNNAPGTDGARIVGYNDATLLGATNVAEALNNLNIVKGGLVNGTYNFATSTGTATAYKMTLPINPLSFQPGCIVHMIPHVSCTGGATSLELLGFAPAHGVKIPMVSEDPAANDMIIGQIAVLQWDGSNWQLLNPARSILVASNTQKGISRLATDVEIYQEESLDGLVCRPSNLKRHPGVSVAFAKVTAAGAIDKSWNITSVVRTGIGAYTITLADTMADQDYEVYVSLINNGAFFPRIAGIDYVSTSVFDINTYRVAPGISAEDLNFCFRVFGEIAT